MKRRCLPLILVLAALLILASIGWLALPKTSQAAPSGDAAFKGKILLVGTSANLDLGTGDPKYFLIEKAQVETMGGQSWLMGKGASDKAAIDWYKGRTVRIRMEQIVSIIDFDDLEKAQRAFASVAEHLPAPRFPRPEKDQ